MPRKPALTITWNGETRSYIDWALKSGVPADTIRSRLRKGWAIGDALSIKHKNRSENASKAANARWLKMRKKG